jgi:hypothetical protein
VEQKTSIGRIVHYVAYGTPGGEYASVCRAAIVTEVPPVDRATAEGTIGLCVLNPTGMFFNQRVPHCEELKGGTWHWPERT